MTADLSALIARLEAAEVGCRGLDAAVYDQLFPRLTRDGEVVPGFPGRWPFHPGSAHDAEVRTVTTSLDAALALADRVLPEETFWEMSHNAVISGQRMYHADVFPPEQSGEAAFWGYASTPVLALCIAILRAKQGEG